MSDDGKILIPMPGSGVMIGYASQAERDQSIRLAQARQAAAERTGDIPSWSELGEHDQEMSVLEARDWLRAAVEAGLLADPGLVTEWGVIAVDRNGRTSEVVNFGTSTYGTAEAHARRLAGIGHKDNLTWSAVIRKVSPWTLAPEKENDYAR